MQDHGVTDEFPEYMYRVTEQLQLWGTLTTSLATPNPIRQKLGTAGDAIWIGTLNCLEQCQVALSLSGGQISGHLADVTTRPCGCILYPGSDDALKCCGRVVS